MIKDIHERIETEWLRCFQVLLTGEFFQRLEIGTLNRDHYAAFLVEEYHNTSENPKIMALFVARFAMNYHRSLAKLLKHAAMEMGHNEMALNDFAVLGGDKEKARKSKPLISTEALSGNIIFQMEHRHPLTFLGYLYHMESISLRLAGRGGDIFSQQNIPEAAMTFLREHSDADPTHLQWNAEYLADFVIDEKDLEAVKEGIRTTCYMHGQMFQGIVDSVEKRGYYAVNS